MRGQDLLIALADELNGLKPELAQAYDLGTSAQDQSSEAGASEARAHANESFASSVSRLSEAAGYMGLAGVQRVAATVLANLQHLDPDDLDARTLLRPFFTEWAGMLEDHLRDAASAAPIEALLAHFGGEWVPLPLDELTLSQLRAELGMAISIGAALDENDSAAPAALVASDLTLDVSNDVDAALLDAFMHDSPPQAADVIRSLQGWIADPTQSELLRTAKRAAHTLKGSASILGIRGIARLAHRLEDILEICEAESAAPSASRAQALMAAADCLEQMVAAVAGEDTVPDNALGIVAQLDAARESNDPILDTAHTDDASDTVRQRALAALATVAAGAPSAVAEGSARAEPKATTRVPTKLLEDVMRMVGELAIKHGELELELKNATEHSRQLVIQDRSIQKRLFELENSVDIRGLAARHQMHSAPPLQPVSSDFDSLEMDQYNEVQSITRALMEEAHDSRDLGLGLKDELAGLAGILHQQQRLMRELQHLTSQTRMAPIANIVPRLQRNVRQTTAATGKEASLHVIGGDILVDTDVLNQLIEPLLHILRNAIDHGLEMPQERIALGKPREGSITLTVTRRGQIVAAQVSDDGRGLVLELIRNKAVERGMVAADATLSDAEIARLTLLPGFSTRDAVTEISGRGVGLDVVATRLRALAGSIDIRSEAGRGLTIELRFQASLMATHALFVRDGGQVFGLASHSVRRAFPAVAVSLARENGVLFAHVDDQKFAAQELSALTGLAPAFNPERRNLVVLNTETGPLGLLVDAVLDTGELVTRPTGKYLKRLPGVAGIGLLGDGGVIPLLDIADLARSPRELSLRSAAEARSNTLRRARILVVDDSLSVRRAVATLLEDQGYDVLLARDGLDAAKSMEASRPDLLITDLEMPNMNGLELAAHTRSRPQLAQLPVIMITSRSMDKHRRQAMAAGVNVYLTKPYTDLELLKHVANAVTGRAEKRAAAG